jgi:hypothetical protein
MEGKQHWAVPSRPYVGRGRDCLSLGRSHLRLCWWHGKSRSGSLVYGKVVREVPCKDTVRKVTVQITRVPMSRQQNSRALLLLDSSPWLCLCPRPGPDSVEGLGEGQTLLHSEPWAAGDQGPNPELGTGRQVWVEGRLLPVFCPDNPSLPGCYHPGPGSTCREAVMAPSHSLTPEGYVL